MSYFTKENGEYKVGKITAHIIGGLFIFILLFSSFGTVPAGSRGVKTRFSAVVGTVEQGLFFKLPFIESVKKMEVKTRTINYDKNGNEGDSSESSQLFAASKDLQDVQIAVIVNYHIDPTKVDLIYSQYSSVRNFESNVIEPIVRETVKSLSAQYTAEELVTKRAEYADKVTSLMAARFTEKYAVMERFNVTNFEFSKSFTQSIEAKVTAEQNALAAKNKLEQVKFEAQQKIETAKAEAEAIRIQAQAIENQGGVGYVNLKAVEKWNGQLPVQMIPNATLPFINLK